MIIRDMRLYDFFTLGENNGYGQPTLPEEPTGTIKMTINLTSQSVQDNINYTNAQYMGLTHDAAVNDTYVIQYGEERLKVLYVNPFGRMKQVFMERL